MYYNFIRQPTKQRFEADGKKDSNSTSMKLKKLGRFDWIRLIVIRHRHIVAALMTNRLERKSTSNVLGCDT